MADLPALISRERTPALHALVHRYGIPSGATVAQQEQARRELLDALSAAHELGRRDARAEVRERLQVVLGGLDGVLEGIGDDRETLPAPGLAGGTAA